MKPYLLIPFIFLFIFKGYCQNSLTGVVVNSNGEPIAFATIGLLNQNKSVIIKSSVTDQNGTFRLLLNDSLSKKSQLYIYASYLRSRTDTLPVLVNQNSLKLIIHDSVHSLNEVTINAETPTMLRKADRFIFTPNKAITEGASVLDVIRITPLLQYDNKNDLFTIINKDGTIVYINGRKSVLPKEMIISLLRSTPANNIKNIEIITNPGSEYPANTTGGVININLKKMIDDGWSGNVMIGSEQSNYNTTILNGIINYRKNKFAIRISPFVNNSFNYNTSQSLVEPTKNQLQNTDKRSFRRYLVLGGGLGIDYDVDKQNLLSFSGFLSIVNGTNTQSSFTQYYKKNNVSLDSLYASPIQGKDRYIYNFGNIYFLHRFDTLNKKQFNVNIDYNQFYQRNNDLGLFNKLIPTNPNSVSSQYNNILPEKFFNISVGIDYSSQISSKSKVNIGGQSSNTNVADNLNYFYFNNSTSKYELNSSLSNYFKYFENYTAIYSTYSKTFNSKFSGVFGLRIEHTNYSTENLTTSKRLDSTYTNIFPNISLSYLPNKNTSLSFSASKKIRRPQIELLFPGRTYYNPNFFSENNPFLQPVILYNYELLFSYKYKYYFTTGYSLYKNQFSQFIIPSLNNGDIEQQKTYLNYGNLSTTYISFFTSQKLIKEIWDMNLNANVNFANYKVKTTQMLGISTSGINNINYNFALNNIYYISNKKKIIAFAIFKYYSPIENISFNQKNILFSTDIGVRKTIKSLSLNLYIADAFNTNGKTRVFYRPNSAYLYNELVQNNYTRSISLNLRYTFGKNNLKVVKNKNSANEDIKRRIN